MIMKFGQTGGQKSFCYVTSICPIPASHTVFYTLCFFLARIWCNTILFLIFFDMSINCPSLLVLYF